ncbi:MULTISPECIES: fimbrial biogenesis chaperone [Enterobacter]|uniref:Molecular chaperone n=1 Tax=Enterobacter vonholyi TaxID=2797505 RepID=A0ABU6E453_9ENTR|nr:MULTISPECIES: molecular chaperone [Enterobacter]QBN09261.1 molecular chaperone [Enterobacter cloacae complex sp.]MCM7618092.1 molecular chaperone [Enterobacter vonholyi]MEB6411003.1 molecular chaperone [Enterobacter vonholyi]MEB7625527.1 molecular chaperone [Enterobacter vonholyi]THC28608.1 molecular chaperone [Enterobacter sp. AD2-3]
MKIILSALLCCIVSASCVNANATVNIGGTRLLYNGDKKEVSLSVNNPDSTPYLIQTVVDNLTSDPKKPPFIITPPLYRLNGGKENLMRIIMTGGLPQDKESMFWLRVKAIPSAPREKNTLQIAVATSIKLIYRPTALKDINVEKESGKLSWRVSGHKLEITNPTPCFINFNEIILAGKKLQNVSYAAPGTTTTFDLPSGVNGGNLQFSVISDFGAVGSLHSTSV